MISALGTSDEYDKPSAMMAHSRSIALFRKAMGPHYDLSALWEKHCEYEFATRDVDATMATMVSSPYVNHIPTMTGGVGYTDLHRFYKNHFIPKTPADTKLIPISRTIGADRLVDEMLFCFFLLSAVKTEDLIHVIFDNLSHDSKQPRAKTNP